MFHGPESYIKFSDIQTIESVTFGKNGPTPIQLYKDMGKRSSLSIILEKADKLYTDSLGLDSKLDIVLRGDNYDQAKEVLLMFDTLTPPFQKLYLDCFSTVLEAQSACFDSNQNLKGVKCAVESGKVLQSYLLKMIKEDQ